jgi:hypothetical protein
MQGFITATKRTLFGGGLRLAAIAGSLAMVTAFAQPALAQTATTNKAEIGGWTPGTPRNAEKTPVKKAIENEEGDRMATDKALSDRIGDWSGSTDRAAKYPDRFVQAENADGEPLFNADGTPTLVQKRDAAGNLVFDGDRNPVFVPKKTMTMTIDENTTTLGEHTTTLGEHDEEIGDWKEKNKDNTITDVIGIWTPDTDRAENNTSVKTAIENEEEARINADNALGRRIDKNSEAIEDAIALSAAIPDSWLSDSENFALALGGGFTDGSSAFGGIGTFRINKNLSAYGGGSTLTDGGTWAAKGGVRLGW